MKILALDPGGTTGWAFYNSSPEKDGINWKQGQIGPQEHHLDLYEFIHDIHSIASRCHEPLWLVCESFEYRNGLTKAELISNEYIGIAKLSKMTTYDTRVIWQTANMGKLRPPKPPKMGSFVQKKHLERLGLWIPNMKHAMDAYGHMLYYVINGGNSEMAKLRTLLLQEGWKP